MLKYESTFFFCEEVTRILTDVAAAILYFEFFIAQCFSSSITCIHSGEMPDINQVASELAAVENGVVVLSSSERHYSIEIRNGAKMLFR